MVAALMQRAAKLTDTFADKAIGREAPRAQGLQFCLRSCNNPNQCGGLCPRCVLGRCV